MSTRLTAAELVEMERRFQKMGGNPSKSLTQAQLRVMEDKFRKMERDAAMRTFRATGGRKI